MFHLPHLAIASVNPLEASKQKTTRTPVFAPKLQVSGPKEILMLWTIFLILLIGWLIGVVSSATFGGFIHLLLLIAVVILVFQLVTRERPAL